MNRKIISDIASASASQALFFVIPLLLIPHLTTALMPTVFGYTVIAQSYASMASLIVDWDHSWRTTRDIAKTTSIRQRSVLISRAWTGQLFLSGCFVFVFSISLPLFEKSLLSAISLESALLLVASLAFQLSWAMNGIQAIKVFAVISVIQRLSLLGASILLIQNPNHAGRYIFILALCQIGSGLVSILYLWRLGYKIFPTFRRRSILRGFKSGGDLFSARIAVSVYTSLVPILIAKVAGAQEVAIYAIADKVRLAAFSAISPITQVLFPSISHLIFRDPKSAANILGWSATLILALSFSISVAIFLAADEIVRVLAPDSMVKAANVLRIVAPLPFIVSVSNLLGIQIMIPTGQSKRFRDILVVAAIGSIPLILGGSVMGGAIGAGSAVVLVEIFVSVMMAISLRTFFGGLISGERTKP